MTHLLLYELHLHESTSTVLTSHTFFYSVEVKGKHVAVRCGATFALGVQPSSGPIAHGICPLCAREEIRICFHSVSNYGRRIFAGCTYLKVLGWPQ